MLMLSISCSDEGGDIEHEVMQRDLKKAVYSQIKPTEKYPAGSVWQVEYGENVLRIPMDYMGQRSHRVFVDVFLLSPTMTPGKSFWP